MPGLVLLMKILIVTLSNLGDMILTFPVFQAIYSAYPLAMLDVISGEGGGMIFRDDPRIHQWIVYDKKMSLLKKWQFIRQIRSKQYDLIVDLRRSAIGFLGSAKKRNRYFSFVPKNQHRALKHLDALKGCLPAGAGLVPTRGVWLDGLIQNGRKHAGARHDVPLHDLQGDGPYIVAAVGSKSDVKKWPTEKYAELLWSLASERKASIVLIGDKNDVQDAEKVRSQISAFSARVRHVMPTLHDMTGKTDFHYLLPIVQKASLVITNDSAPLHLADSLGVPVLAIFGPTNPKKYGPRGKISAVISKNLFCQPCEKAQCRFHHECLKDLSVGEVRAKAIQLLEGNKRDEDYKILVIRLDRVGDLVLSLPAIQALRERFPQAKISLMARTYTRELLEGHPLIDEVIPYDYKKGGRHAFPLGYFYFLKEIKKRQFDAALILHPGIRSALIPFLCAIPKRVGYQDSHAWLLTHAAPDERSLGKKHESQYALDLAQVLTGQPFSPEPPKLYPDPAALWSLQKKTGVHPKQRFIAIHAGASCPSKRWPKENFRALIEQLFDEFPHDIVIVGGNEEKLLSGWIADGFKSRVLNLSGQMSLPELTALFSQCDLLVSNDSGPVHVAAAVGTPVISLFGRNQAGLGANRWKPLGEGHETIWKDVGCLVCLAHECTIGFECLKAIRVGEVMDATRKIISRTMAVKK